MKKLIIFLFILILTPSLKAQNGELISKGVLYCKEKAVYILPDTILVFNKNGSLNATMLKHQDAIEVQYSDSLINLKENQNLKTIYPYYYNDNSKYNAPIPNLIIRAYYPDYGIFVIDANKINDKDYEVFINGEWKIIKENSTLQYKKWGDFIKDLLIKLPDNISLHCQKNIKSKKMTSQKDLSYKVLEVNGDWIKIECNKNCDDCNEKQPIKGWVKWKNGNNLLVYLYYVC